MLPPTDSASCWTTAARSEGLATNRFIVSPVRPNRTRYFAITTTPTCTDGHLAYRSVSRLPSAAPTLDGHLQFDDRAPPCEREDAGRSLRRSEEHTSELQ